MVEVGYFESNRERIRIAIALVSIVLIIVASFVSYSYKSVEPVVIVEESEMGGTTGYTVSKTTCAAQREIIIYNGTVNDPSADWYYDSQHCEVHNDEFGVNVELSGIVELTSTYSQFSLVEFYGNPTLPLMNYSKLTVSINIRSLMGSANVSLYVYPTAWPDDEYNEVWNNTARLEEMDSISLVAESSLHETYNLGSGWIVRSNILVKVAASEKSLIQIGAVLVTAESNEDLYPVTFDMQAPDGESLLVNPYMSTLRELNHKTVNGEFGCSPAIELSRNSNTTEASIFVPRTSNETLYLTAGQYEGIAGWFIQSDGFGESWNNLLDDLLNIGFILESGDSIRIQIRISAYRLSIDLSPAFAYCTVWIDAGTSGYVARYNGYFPLQGIEYLFVPRSTAYSISLGASFIENTHVFIETDGTTCVHISIAYPQFTIWGIILDWGQILGLVGATLLLLLVVQGGMKRSFAGIRRDRSRGMSLVPVSLYFIAMFLPWMNYSFENTFAGPAMTVYGMSIVPIFTTFIWSTTSQVTPILSNNLFLIAIPIVFLYWIPLGYVSYLTVTSINPISRELSSRNMNSVVKGTVLGGPFILGCYYLWLCILGLYFINIGLVAILLSLPSWCVIFRIENQNNQIHPASNNS